MSKMSASSAIKSILSSSIGNVLEWYEYTLYAYFAPVISALFFPANDHRVSMLMTFLAFAIGLAARPIGGIIFGHIGDKCSRRKMLVLTMLLMSIPTLCIGCLPTYEKIGIMAPICLVVIRILQGVALGGEFGASCVYLFESVPHNRRGFYGCMALTGVGTGLVLSSCTIFMVESFVSQEAIYAYAWRVPFFISVLGALIGFYMRRNLLETKDFIVARQDNKLLGKPLVEMLKKHKASLLYLFSIFITTQISFFIVFIFGKSMMMEFLHYDSHTAGKFNLLTVISYTLATLFFGYLSDKVNKKYLVVWGAFGILVAVYPFIWSLKAGNSSMILLLSVLMGILIGMTEGTLNPVTAESFPTNIRATSVAFCWNFTSVAFGGSAPIIAMWLINHCTVGVDAVAYYLMIACAITVVSVSCSLFRNRNRSRMELSVEQVVL